MGEIQKKKIFMYGIGTYKNRGVEAIVNSTLNLIDPNKYDITIATYDYDNNKNKYATNVKYINHYKDTKDFTKKELAEYKKMESEDVPRRKLELYHEKQLISAIKEADICISSGGDNYCYGVSDWLYAIDEMIRKENKKLIFWCGSLYEDLSNQEELVSDMNLFDMIVCREKTSYNALKKYINKEKLMLTPDPAFGLKITPVKLNKWYKNRKVVGLNVSPLTIKNPVDGDDRFESVINLINYILSETKYSISLIPHVTTDDCNDLDILKKIYEKYTDEERVFLEKADYDCTEIKYIISQCDIMIAARTHASIAAYSTKVPTLVIGYSVKSKGIATDLFGTDKGYVIQCDKLKDNNLIDAFMFINKNKKSIKKRLNEEIDQKAAEAKKIFANVLEKLEENDNNHICRPDSCIGCGVCKNNCPQHAIEMVKDKMGFIHPKINKEKCINCKVCVIKCPTNIKNEYDKTFKKIIYAAKNKNLKVRKESTSGGVFSVMAEQVLSKNGIVYGAATIDNRVKHIRIDDKKDLPKIRGSKYAQSSILEIVDQINDDIKDERLILFSGTPCQVGAISKLFKNNENIIFVSVICHGVINDDIKEQYLQEQYPNELVRNLNYRTKENGWEISSIRVDTNENTYVNKFNDDILMNLFVNNLILRNSCYECKYKGDNNIADIIIGDFWGAASVYKELFDNQGVSSIIVNSEKGQKFFEKNKILKKLDYQNSSLENIRKYNLSYEVSPMKPLKRFMLENEVNKNLTLMYECEKNKQEIQSLEQKNKELVMTNNNRILALQEEIDQMRNSKRWKVVDKTFNVINGVFKRK